MTRKSPPPPDLFHEELVIEEKPIPLSAIFLDCTHCERKKVWIFVCYCRKDICLRCAWEHQQGCEPARTMQIAPRTD